VSRGIDQNSPHRLGSGGKEVAATVPVSNSVCVHQAQIRLVHQSRRLKRLSGLLLGQLLRRQFPKFIVDEWQEPFRSERIALVNRGKNLRHVAHRTQYNQPQ
jgi:hypothetical protein